MPRAIIDARAAVVVAAAVLLGGAASGSAGGDLFVASGGKTTIGGEADFGSSVALSSDGTIALVGAPGDGFVGAAWVLERSGEGWAQPGARLTAARGSNRYRLDFGASVALSADGRTALVGAPGERDEWGAVRVFTRSAAGWDRRGIRLRAVDEAGVGDGRGARFGLSVALSADGDTALVGGDWDDGGRGAAWVFTHTGAAWKQTGRKLTAPPSAGGEAFGRSVALSADGTTALVGRRGEPGSAGGAVVFTRAGGGWKRQGAPLTGPRDRVTGSSGDLGASVALSADGHTALVAAPATGTNVGAVWTFTRTRGTWSKTAKLGPHDRVGNGRFGTSVALSADGETALVGAPWDDRDAGAAYVFTRSRATWRQRGVKLTGADEVVADDGMFGARSALSPDGAVALIGGTGRGLQDAPGAVWTFDRDAKRTR